MKKTQREKLVEFEENFIAYQEEYRKNGDFANQYDLFWVEHVDRSVIDRADEIIEDVYGFCMSSAERDKLENNLLDYCHVRFFPHIHAIENSIDSVPIDEQEYQIDFDTLRDLGINPDRVNTTNLEMYWRKYDEYFLCYEYVAGRVALIFNHAHFVADTRGIMLSDAHGVYIPQIFLESLSDENRRSLAKQIGWRSYRSILRGPDDDWYWDAWDAVLNNGIFYDERNEHHFRLYQDGDLFWQLCDEDGK